MATAGRLHQSPNRHKDPAGRRKRSFGTLSRRTIVVLVVLLTKYADYVKTGVTDVAYVKVEQDAAWPSDLEVRLPDE
jgi:hypothetical protein